MIYRRWNDHWRQPVSGWWQDRRASGMVVAAACGREGGIGAVSGGGIVRVGGWRWRSRVDLAVDWGVGTRESVGENSTG